MPKPYSYFDLCHGCMPFLIKILQTCRHVFIRMWPIISLELNI